MKRKLIYISSILFLLVGIFCCYKYYEKKDEEKRIILKKQQEKLKMEKLKSKYNKYVVTNKETNLYVLNNGKYDVIGKINKDIELSLSDIELDVDVEYFLIDTYEDEYYISYKDIEPIDNMTEIDYRYKKYIIFNKNIKTDDSIKLYCDDKYVIEINREFDFPIIFKDKDRIYVEYGQQLYYIKSEDVVLEYDKNNTSEKIGNKVRTLVYHRIFDPKTEQCNQVICHKEEDFDMHMKYLSDNGYLSLTMKELELFIDGNLQIPVKSVVITIDDGTMDKRAIPILEKYKINATLFLVTSRFKEQDYIDFTSEYLELHSHTHNMHWAGECSGYGSQGGGILCLDEDHVLNDLKTSREMLNGSIAFCYPFYDYNKRAIELLKQAGFTMAFAGDEGKGGYSYVGTNKMLIPRLTLNAYTTYKMFVSYVN